MKTLKRWMSVPSLAFWVAATAPTLAFGWDVLPGISTGTQWHSATLYPDGDHVLFVGDKGLNNVVRISLSDFSVASASSTIGYAKFIGGVTNDFDHNGLYLGDVSTPGWGRIFKLREDTLDVMDALAPGTGEVYDSLLDAREQVLYAIARGVDEASDDHILKFDLKTFSKVAELRVPPSQHSFSLPRRLFMHDGYLYASSVANVFKVRLSDFTLVKSLTLQSNYLMTGFIDSNRLRIYAGGPGGISIVDLTGFTSQLASKSAMFIRACAFDAVSNTSYWWQDNYPRASTIFRMDKDLKVTGSVTFAPDGSSTSIPGVLVWDAPRNQLLGGMALWGDTSQGGGVMIIRGGEIVRVPITDFIAVGGGGGGGGTGTNSVPVILSQPGDQQIALEQASATFSITATGASSYQWTRNGVPIPGAESASYTLSVTVADNGARFACVVSNAYGSQTSSSAKLILRIEPRVYPNPWRADRSRAERVQFDRLLPGTSVTIYTLNRQRVATLAANEKGLAVWDLKSRNGEPVASGYYFYHAASPDDVSSSSGKLAIVR